MVYVCVIFKDQQHGRNSVKWCCKVKCILNRKYFTYLDKTITIATRHSFCYKWIKAHISSTSIVCVSKYDCYLFFIWLKNKKYSHLSNNVSKKIEFTHFMVARVENTMVVVLWKHLDHFQTGMFLLNTIICQSIWGMHKDASEMC